MSARIRRAETADADALTSLAQSSKAFWGYDAAFMEACRAELTLDDRDMVDDPTFMIEAEGRVLGFYQLRLQGAGADMRMVFVAPEAVRSGIGRRLGPHLERRARAMGVTRLEVVTRRAFIARCAWGAPAERHRAASPAACCRIW